MEAMLEVRGSRRPPGVALALALALVAGAGCDVRARFACLAPGAY